MFAVVAFAEFKIILQKKHHLNQRLRGFCGVHRGGNEH